MFYELAFGSAAGHCVESNLEDFDARGRKMVYLQGDTSRRMSRNRLRKPTRWSITPEFRCMLGHDLRARYFLHGEPSTQCHENAGKVSAAAYSRSQYEMAAARRTIMSVFLQD